MAVRCFFFFFLKGTFDVYRSQIVALESRDIFASFNRHQRVKLPEHIPTTKVRHIDYGIDKSNLFMLTKNFVRVGTLTYGTFCVQSGITGSSWTIEPQVETEMGMTS